MSNQETADGAGAGAAGSSAGAATPAIDASYKHLTIAPDGTLILKDQTRPSGCKLQGTMAIIQCNEPGMKQGNSNLVAVHPDTLEVLWQYPGKTLVTFSQFNTNAAPASFRDCEIEFRGTLGNLSSGLAVLAGGIVVFTVK